MRDELGPLFTETTFAPLLAVRGRPAEAPGRLALITMMPSAEGLSDRQATDAVRSRIDWKDALGLELTDPGFDRTGLSEFRTRLVVGQAASRLLDALLERCRDRQRRHGGRRQRTDSTPVLGAMRAVNRVVCVAETMRHALNRLAVVAPAWRRADSRPEWLERYGPRVHDERVPTGEPQRQASAQTGGRAGDALLDAMDREDAPKWLHEVPAVETLRSIWVPQWYRSSEGVRWRTAAAGLPPAAQRMSSPEDLDAHDAKQDTTSWVGDNVHVTESGEPEQPPLSTPVETTAGPVADAEVTHASHAQLPAKQLLPNLPSVATGYLDAELLGTSPRDDGVDWRGPTRPDDTWQARAGPGFAASHCVIDWNQRQARCLMGQASISWTPATDGQNHAVIKIQCSPRDCQACASRRDGTHAKRRTITVRPEAQHLS